jgi:uncharacterized protein involved in exopolysaccharide biosynthesis
MSFSELEQLMSSRGVNTLAEIARALNTTPQAVSNWKARNQVPHHIVANLNKILQLPADSPQASAQYPNPQFTTHYSPLTMEEDTMSLSDILLTMAEQLKVIALTTFIFIFLTFTYVQFIQTPQYVSWATVLLPSSSGGNLGGLAGLASQFGVNVPTGNTADLSSPSLFPELLRSRTFAEKILDKKFYTKEFGKELTFLEILNKKENSTKIDSNRLISSASSVLNSIIKFEKSPTSTFSIIKVTTFDPVLAKELAEVILSELEKLNRFFKSKAVSEKTSFIENRILTVKDQLDFSEKRVKEFNEKNRQISSPSLQLELSRLSREVEVQKGIYLTLKQQYELSKIEEVQEISIVQILDRPEVPLGPSNKNIKLSVITSGLLGCIIGIMLAFARGYVNNKNIDERKKLRRIKNFIKKKAKDFLFDKRVSGIISFILLIVSPFYIGHKSSNPIYFDMYSPNTLMINILYLLTLTFFIGLFIRRKKK